MLEYTKVILFMLFIVSVFGYIFSVIKEKIYLKNNIIVIDKKSVTQEHIEEADMKEFIFDGYKIKSGDEIKVTLKGNRKVEGILIGAKLKDRSMLIVTHKDEVKKLAIDSIKKLRIISKYGKFFKII